VRRRTCAFRLPGLSGSPVSTVTPERQRVHLQPARLEPPRLLLLLLLLSLLYYYYNSRATRACIRPTVCRYTYFVHIHCKSNLSRCLHLILYHACRCIGSSWSSINFRGVFRNSSSVLFAGSRVYPISGPPTGNNLSPIHRCNFVPHQTLRSYKTARSFIVLYIMVYCDVSLV
jgi:hypothetical protein